jgi:sensor histidine kinase YesM
MRPATALKIFSPGSKTFFKKIPLLKLLAIAVISTGIVYFSGVITTVRYQFIPLLFICLYFIAMGWIIWEGSIEILAALKKNLPLIFKTYYKTVIVLYTAVILYTGLVAVAGILFSFLLFDQNVLFDHRVSTAVITAILFVLFAVNISEILYLKEQQQDIEKRAEQLNIAKTHAELVALKNQIDPHFLFNSLNTLSYLISSDPVNARLYNDTLAKVYRYILINREKNLVSASEEIEFLSNFFYLLKIRFDDAINMNIEIKSIAAEALFLPPISLQILLENAIKHNEISVANPLTVLVSLSSNYVVIKNRLMHKTYKAASTGTGLNNLDNRYKLLTGKNIIVYRSSDYFTVKLPLVNLQL